MHTEDDTFKKLRRPSYQEMKNMVMDMDEEHADSLLISNHWKVHEFISQFYAEMEDAAEKNWEAWNDRR